MVNTGGFVRSLVCTVRSRLNEYVSLWVELEKKFCGAKVFTEVKVRCEIERESEPDRADLPTFGPLRRVPLSNHRAMICCVPCCPDHKRTGKLELL